MKGIKNRDPDKTRNGRTKLLPLGIVQLEKLLAATSNTKQKGHIRQELDRKISKRNKLSKALTA
jgi:hypothetical protein